MNDSSLYSLLGVAEDASRDTIRKEYQRQLLLCHPDKHVTKQIDSNEHELRIRLDTIRQAWDVLGDVVKRKDYDKELKAGRLRQTAPMDIAVDLDDMVFTKDTGVYTYACRCSGEYLLTEADLEAGAELVNCSQCSLRIHVLYQCIEEME